MKNNPLIFIPSPRNIPDVWDAIERNVMGRFDVLVVKNYSLIEAYNVGARYLLANYDKYSHLCIVPDDLIVTKEPFDLLLSNIDNFWVLSGVCNLGCYNDFELEHTNISIGNIPDLEDHTEEQISKMWLTYEQLGENKKPLRVEFAGFPCTFIRKEIIKKMKKFKANKYGVSMDSVFCKFLVRNDIDHWIIPAAQFAHLKHHPKYKKELKINTGIEEKEIYLFDKNKKSKWIDIKEISYISK